MILFFLFLVFFWIIWIFSYNSISIASISQLHIFVTSYLSKRLKIGKNIFYVIQILTIPGTSHSSLLFLLLALSSSSAPYCHFHSKFQILAPSFSQNFDVCSLNSSVLCVGSSLHRILSLFHIICVSTLGDHSPVPPRTVHCLKTIISLFFPACHPLIYSGWQLPWQLILQRQKLIFIYCL